jgi:hypothetical protein
MDETTRLMKIARPIFPLAFLLPVFASFMNCENKKNQVSDPFSIALFNLGERHAQAILISGISTFH